MSLTVGQIITRALVLLNDEGAVRWPVSEIIGWINEGARYAVSAKPNLLTQRIDITLVQGVDQAVPDNVNRIMRFDANTNGNAVTPASVQMLDSFVSGWRSATLLGQRATVRHVVVDETDLRTFQVVPSNDGTGSLSVLAVMRPTDIALADTRPTQVSSYNAVASPFADIEGDALVDYVVYRAASKDVDLPGVAMRAGTHFQKFAQSLGIEIQSETTQRPEVPATDPTV